MVRVADARIRFDLSSDISGVSLFGEGSADSAATRTSSVKQPALRFAITIPSDTLAQVRGDLEANATSVANTTRVVANPTLRLQLDGPTATASVVARESPTLGPVDILVSANRINGTWNVSFDRFLATASGYAVSVGGDHRVDLYRDAVAVQTLSFLSPGPAGQRQTIDFHGTYSPSSADTLLVTANEVDLERLSAFAGLKKPLQGSASGRMEIVQVNAVPVLAGTVRVDRLGLDDRVLGDFTAVSSFSTRSNEVDVTATLSPAGGGADVAADVDDVQLTSVANDLTVTGVVRFAGSSSTRSTGLDLTVDVRRADMFFFEYVFPHTIDNVTGRLAGTGSIRGTLARPVFGANLILSSGAFSVPEFNLNLGITADITVDADAIRITRATVTDGGGGITDLSGDVLFNDYRYFSLNLSGNLQDFQIMNITHSNELPFYGNIRGSGLLTLSGPISGATLRAADAVTTAESEVYIPLVNAVAASDDSFIVFADSTGFVSDPIESTRRNVLSTRPRGERSFLDGLELDLNIFAPQGSTVHLVIDPLVGDVINAVGTGRVQIRRRGGEFSTFGVLEVNSGDYLFTAGDVFVRQFNINSGGRITWDGDPTNAILDIPASYETRASRAGLPGSDGSGSAIPLIVRLRITGRVETPQVDLSLEVDRTNRDISGNYAALEAVLNQPSRSTEYATSVLVSNSFLLTTSDVGTEVLASSAFNSVSQLVSSQINRYLNEALPNVDFSFGVQGESTQELGVTYGVALRLLDERLVIRGQGVYQGARTEATDVSSQNLEGEFVVEIKLSPTVSVEVFYRREGDVLTNNATLTGSTGAGVSYSTEFSTWRQFFSRIFRTSSRSGGTSD
jgi:hypothetical protein